VGFVLHVYIKIPENSKKSTHLMKLFFWSYYGRMGNVVRLICFGGVVFC
jgi:hypothetical protein